MYVAHMLYRALTSIGLTLISLAMNLKALVAYPVGLHLLQIAGIKICNFRIFGGASKVYMQFLTMFLKNLFHELLRNAIVNCFD